MIIDRDDPRITISGLFVPSAVQIGDDEMIFEALIEIISEEKALFEIGLVLSLLSYAALIVAQWKIFTKAGEKGWKALIPFYSIFVSHHMIGMRHIWFILDIVFWAIEVVLDLVPGPPLWLEETFFSIAIVFTLISEILHIMKLCYCFTKRELFGVGLFILPPVFSLILAFDSSEYNPPRSHRERESSHTASDT